MTHLKRQKLISSTQVRGYNTQFLLYPRLLLKWLCNRFYNRLHRVYRVLTSTTGTLLTYLSLNQPTHHFCSNIKQRIVLVQ